MNEKILSTKISDINSARTLAEMKKKGEQFVESLDTSVKVSDIAEETPVKRNYDRGVLFQNIRELIKHHPDAKLGEIEKASNQKPGYVARLERTGTKTEPTVNFVVTAAKELGVSIDYLIKAPIANLTPTEKYLIEFLDKLKRDTIDYQLEWEIGFQNDLNHEDPDVCPDVKRLLYTVDFFTAPGAGGHIETSRRWGFSSRCFDKKTYIAGDCFWLNMKNDSRLFIMNVKPSFLNKNEGAQRAIEVWLVTYVYNKTNTRYLCSSQDGGAVADAVNALHSSVENYAKHPKLKSDITNVIDAFMNGDLGQDDISF